MRGREGGREGEREGKVHIFCLRAFVVFNSMPPPRSLMQMNYFQKALLTTRSDKESNSIKNLLNALQTVGDEDDGTY